MMRSRCYLLMAVLTSSTTAGADKPVVAVFDIEDKGASLSEQTRNRITDYLTSSLASTGAYQVVPRSTLKERLSQQKKDSLKRCYEESCQIDIGRELAAQKSLSTQVIKIASECLIAAVMYDLKRAASEGGARAEGGCSEKQILGSIKRVIDQLVAPSKTLRSATSSTQPTGPGVSLAPARASG